MRTLMLLVLTLVSSATGCRLFHRDEPSQSYRYVAPPDLQPDDPPTIGKE